MLWYGDVVGNTIEENHNVLIGVSYIISVSYPPFPQIDIIRAVVIVWRVRGKTIRFVLCNIVCNNCAQCNTHI